MKLLYLANYRLPTEKAYGIQIVEMCRAFAQAGADVELAVPTRWGHQGEDILGYYGISAGSFQVRRLRTLQWYPGGALRRIAFWVMQGYSAVVLAWHGVRSQADVLYCRDELTTLAAAIFHRRVVCELHSFSGTRRPFYAVMRLLGVRLVCITEGLAKRIRHVGYPTERILVAPDGFDAEAFRALPERSDARRRVHLPEGMPIALYAGHLYGWKGADVLAEATPHFDGIVVFVGGTEADIARMKARYGTTSNIMFVGHRPHSEIPLWLRAADVLVLPNRKDDDISEHYTSPLKMFEYMASGTPIVASDLPSIREVLNETNAVLVRPNDPTALTDGIRRAMAHSHEVGRLAAQAREDVRHYDWRQRANRILHFIPTT